MTGREKFEAWLTNGVSELSKMLLVDKFDGGGYSNNVARIQWEAWQAALASQQPADAGWVEWNGGSSVGWKCPIAPEIIVDLKLRDGTRSTLGRPAGTYFWGCSDITPGCDIIAYRVVKP